MKRIHWIYWIKLLAGFALIGILYQKINQRESVWAALQVASWWSVAACAALLIPNIFLAFLKWHYLLKCRYAGQSLRESFGSLLFGYTLGLITPGRLGELGRGLFFSGKNRVTITGLNVLDKFASQLMIITLGGLALLWMVLHEGLGGFTHGRWWFAVGILALLGLWVLVLSPQRLRRGLDHLLQRFPAHQRLRPFVAGFENLTVKDSLVVLGLTLVWYGVIILQYHLLVQAFTPVRIGQSLLAVPAMLFTKTLLPFTFGELGIREGMAVYYYSLFHISGAAVFNASLLVFFFNFLIPALCGIYYVLQIRDSAEEFPESAAAPAEEILTPPPPVGAGKWRIR